MDLIHSHQYSDHLSELPTTIFLVISYLLYSYLLQSQYNQNNSLVLLCILVLFLSLSSCGICIAIFAHYYNMVKVFFWINTENFLLLTQIRILSKFLISLSKMCTSSPKKTHQIYTNLKNCLDLCQKTEISQNTENFHPCYYIYFILKHSYYCNIEVY